MASGGRHHRLRAVFDEALTLAPPDREEFLDRACAGDAALRAEASRLLAAHGDAESFLERPLHVPAAARDDDHFTGNDRFRIIGRLGAGGMGVVYEAHDALRDEIVALKTWQRTGAGDLYRLKQEFRSLADVTHPNLVCLYELFVEEARGFFTMERVHGVSFVEHARGPTRDRLAIDRLVPALQQLADGVSALHRRGKLHRDIKPSNVLVTAGGRVVILDFGLSAELLPAYAVDARYQRGGTPAYMSPEEAAGARPSQASDWYGVGVTLYEALTGSVPFEGPVTELMHRKGTLDPPAPHALAPGEVPQDLSEVCLALLRRDPDERATGDSAMSLLARGAGRRAPDDRTFSAHDSLFVGRERELRALAAAAHRTRCGLAATVAVYGASGIGKSALVRRFLQTLEAPADRVVLAGRCYENESVPFKALDGVVDDVSRYLGSIASSEVAALLPADFPALTRLFPVLLQVHAAADSPHVEAIDPVDPLRVRRRAFDALRELLARLAARRPLVIWIDDVQWVDTDSIVLLDELLGGQPSPAMLTLLTFRSEEIAVTPFLGALLDRSGHDGWSAVPLERMDDDEARALIASVLAAGSALSDAGRQRLAREADGSPFVLEQLALYAAAGRDAGASPTFAGMFGARLASLAPDARRFLETLAICARPMAPEIVCDACGIARDRQSLVTMLRSSRFIRSSGSSARIETYHDRIREVLSGQVADVRAIHGRLAATLVARGSDDCEALFDHYRGAGDLDQASVQAGLAAEKASAALAFDRAASFYRHALELAPAAAGAQPWRERLATAVANAGRPAEAAEAYLQAADGAVERTRQVELRRRAAEQFLIGGHIDEGFGLIGRVLESVGLTASPGPRAALLRLVWRRERLRWRGLRFAPRDAAAIDDETLLRLDTCWAAATGLGLVDVISASDFIAQHLHMALDAGDPPRIARGLALEWCARNADRPYRRGSTPLIEEANRLAMELGTPLALAMATLADSITATAVGEWRRALASSEQALAMLRDRCVGVTWELNIAQNMVIWALMYLGEFGEVSRRVPALLTDARRRGNLYLATEICTRSNIVWLIADQPDEGEREVNDTIGRWSQKGFHRQHYSARLARVQTALYRGDSATAWRLMVEQEADLKRSMLLRVQAFRVEALYLRARCAIAVAAATGERRTLRSARACALRIANERMRWATPLARLLQGGIAATEQDLARARACLADATAQFEAAEMKLYAAVARRRLGEIMGEAAGRAHRQQADDWMASQGIRNPSRLTLMLAPGFPARG